MLILERKTDQAILIQCGTHGWIRIAITGVHASEGNRLLASPRVDVGVDAPKDWLILREEIVGRDAMRTLPL